MWAFALGSSKRIFEVGWRGYNTSSIRRQRRFRGTLIISYCSFGLITVSSMVISPVYAASRPWGLFTGNQFAELNRDCWKMWLLSGFHQEGWVTAMYTGLSQWCPVFWWWDRWYCYQRIWVREADWITQGKSRLQVPWGAGNGAQSVLFTSSQPHVPIWRWSFYWVKLIINFTFLRHG